MTTKKQLAAGALALAVIGATAACGGSSSGGAGDGGSKSLRLVAFSTPQKAYDKLAPAFAATTAGANVTLNGSYGASGTQRDKVLAGAPADIVEFSRASDMTKLVDAGLVAANWNANRYKGIVTDSVAVLIVRKGNPLGIRSWDDLIKPGVKVVTPNPLSSGSACWTLMAAYGAKLKEGKTPTQALTFVKQLLQHTVSQPDSGANATAAFVGGTGDVLIGYENEAIAAQQAGDDIDYVTPDATILIENPVAATTHASNPTLANDFIRFLYSTKAQQIFAGQGYRPVVTADLDKKTFPTPPELFTIDSLGGWSEVNTKFFDPTSGLITKIENDLGHGASG